MTIAFHSTFGSPTEWLVELRRRLPDDDVRLLDDIEDRSTIEFAVVWDIPLSEFASMPNLRAVLLIGSGGSHLRPFEDLPDVPIVRLVDETVATDMAAYALHWIIHFQRRFPTYAEQARKAVWQVHPFTPTNDYTVGLLGHGNIGTQVANVCRGLGYPVRAWSRSPKPESDVETFTGPAELADFLAGTNCLVNVLPLTTETRKILTADRLALLPARAALINMGRGGTIDDDALLAALDNGHLTGAALDVFRAEPLPADSPLWAHPNVHVTPHMSGAAQPRSSVGYIAANIARVRCGEAPYPLFEASRGY